jgi:hypothetical protein
MSNEGHTDTAPAPGTDGVPETNPGQGDWEADPDLVDYEKRGRDTDTHKQPDQQKQA